jgi:four helix bundle protein
VNSFIKPVPTTGHRSLIVWEKSVDLAVHVLRIARLLPAPERYHFAQQMRSSALSIAANIAEGKGRSTRAEYARFLVIARGSARELDTYLEVIYRSGYVTANKLAPAVGLVREVLSMLTAMLRKLTPLKTSP